MDAPLHQRIRVLVDLGDQLSTTNKSLLDYLKAVESGERRPNANLEFFVRMAVRDLQRLVTELRDELNKELGG